MLLVPLAAFMTSRCDTSQGIVSIDSTSLCVCENIRIPRHRTFTEKAGRGKSSTGWFYNLKVTSGFNLHLVVNDRGGIVSYCVTPGNVDDRKPVPQLAKTLLGKLFGDRGYISKDLAEKLASQDIQLITTLKKGMKKQAIEVFDKLMLRKRSIIETINGQLKNCFDLEHSRHRSLWNFLSNVVASLVAYSYQYKKPSPDLRNANLIPLLIMSYPELRLILMVTGYDVEDL